MKLNKIFEKTIVMNSVNTVKKKGVSTKPLSPPQVNEGKSKVNYKHPSKLK